MAYTFTITNKPEGFRDLYWCYNLNEPVIIEFKDDIIVCSNCGCTGGNVAKNPDVGFMQRHQFIGHIFKDV